MVGQRIPRRKIDNHDDTQKRNNHNRLNLTRLSLISILTLNFISIIPSSTSTSALNSTSSSSPSSLSDHPYYYSNLTSTSRTTYLPARRSYDSHHYYSVELKRGSDSKGVDPNQIAHLLGGELVERVGELQDHWLIRLEKLLASSSSNLVRKEAESISSRSHVDFPYSSDPILTRWKSLSNSRHFTSQSDSFSKRDLELSTSILNIERQVLSKRHKRNVIYSPWDTPSQYPTPRSPLSSRFPEFQPYPEEIRRPPPLPAAISTKMMTDFEIKDPIFNEQWHLANDKILGNDLNTRGAWKDGVKGKGVNVCLIDDGLDLHSPDLADNFFERGSYDFNNHVPLPEPRLSDDQHGTRCAGEIAAVKNDACGVGVAYEAHVAGVRILSGPISDADEAAALNYRYQENHIYSCSWGPPDDGRSMDAPKGLIAKALLNGVQNGRDGKGSIFVFAGGNGGASDDQCNFDGYTNSIYSMTIAAVDREGTHPYYSEMCSANLASAWSSGSGDHIHTTDVAWNGVNQCTTMHGGTSAAAPLVAGVAALALQIRPDLTWRDMQHIAVHSAQMIAPNDPDWQKTQAGRHYNHKFGYGVIDATKFVEEARNHKLINPQSWFPTGNITIPKDQTFMNEKGVQSSFRVTQEMLDKANLESLEHVTARVWISHDRRGDVDVELTSPHGTKSVLARPRRYDEADTGFPGWSFMSLKHWDESPIGEWKIEVFDRVHPKKTGNFYAWSMTLWGASIDPSKAVPWNFPESSVEYHETLPAAPDKTEVLIPSGATTYQHAKPTANLPADHGNAPGETHQDFTNGGKPEADTGYLKGLKQNSTWLIVAGGVVIIFAGSVGAFFIMRKRRGRGGNGGRGAGGDYEFVPEEEDMAMSALNGETGSKGKRSKGKGKGLVGKRARELYDAFDDGSDEDDEDEDAPLAGTSARGAASGQGEYRDEEEPEDGRFAIGGDENDKTPTTAGRYKDDDEDGLPERIEEKREEREKEADLLFDAQEDVGEGGSGDEQKK